MLHSCNVIRCFAAPLCAACTDLDLHPGE